MLEPIVPLEDISLFHSSALLCYLFNDNFSISVTLFTSSNNNVNNILNNNKINNNKNSCNVNEYVDKNINKDKDKNYIIDELQINIDVKDKKFKNKLKELLNKYDDVIAISSDDLEASELLPHHIELIEGSKPIMQKCKDLIKSLIINYIIIN